MIRSEGPLTKLGPVVSACLRAGISSVPPSHLAPEEMAAELDDIIGEGLAPVALKLFNPETSGNGTSILRRLSSATMAQQVRSLAADALVDRLSELFRSSDVQFVIIKGPAVARLHPQGWPRPYSDLDLLVEPRHFRFALRALLTHGFAYPNTSLPPWPWFDDYCREGVNLFGVGNVDLHHHLAPWAFGTGLQSSDVIRAADHVVVRGRTVPMASPEHSAVIAALHVLNDLWKGQRGLMSWRDLLVILGRSDFDRVRFAFGESRLDWLLSLAVAAVRGQMPGAADGADGAARLPRRHSWRLRGLGWDRSTALSRHRLAWAIRLPFPQAAAFALGSAVPSPRYIRIRHGSYWSYWQQAWRETLSTFSGGDHRAEKNPEVLASS